MESDQFQILSNFVKASMWSFRDRYGYPIWRSTSRTTRYRLYGAKDKTFHFRYENDFGGIRDIDTTFEGVIPNIDRRYHETNSDFTRDVMRKYMTSLQCQTCHGYRLNRQALAVKIAGKHIGEVSDLPIADELAFFAGLEFSEQATQIARPILKEIKDRLTFLVNVGLDYLNLSRSARTLSGGEAQRSA